MTSWRLILDAASHGAWNMGVDEALLATAIRVGLPTLRFYRWRGPWLSLGYAQRVDPAQLDACSCAGIGIVRRVTGGRAVLHGGDLTYAIAAREADLPPGLLGSYELVAGALTRALATLGVEALAVPRVRARTRFEAGAGSETRGRSETRTGSAAHARPETRAPSWQRRASFDCFASAAGYEIVAAGRKLAGSAQRRAGGGILQHGSIRLTPDPAAIQRACAIDGRRSTSLAELGAGADAEALEAVCVASFREALGGRLALGELSADERSQVEARVRRHARDPSAAPSENRVEPSRHAFAGR